jgi:hypothetical protein
VPASIAAPSSVAGIDLYMLAQKSDTGARSGNLRLISGAAITDYTKFVPGTAMQYYKYAQDTDPNTGNPWLWANLLNVTFGPRVTE